jgi:hypothetical protein
MGPACGAGTLRTSNRLCGVARSAAIACLAAARNRGSDERQLTRSAPSASASPTDPYRPMSADRLVLPSGAPRHDPDVAAAAARRWNSSEAPLNRKSTVWVRAIAVRSRWGSLNQVAPYPPSQP